MFIIVSFIQEFSLDVDFVQKYTTLLAQTHIINTNINNLPSVAQSVTDHSYLIASYNSIEGCTSNKDYTNASMEAVLGVINTCKT